MVLGRTIKHILFALCALITIVIVIAGYIYLSPIPSYENKAPTSYRVLSDSVRIAEGARMASMVCANCHRSNDGKLGGAYLSDVVDFGEVYAPNITNHPKYGLTSNYTDGELAYLLRTGIKRDGQYSPPYMVKFPHLSDEDLNNLIAFLRSDHRMVQPSDNDPPLSKPSFITKLLCRIAFEPLPFPDEPILAPSRNDKVAYGRYLALHKYDCYSCHSADFKTIDVLEPENSEGFFGGGNVLLDLDGQDILSSNLTMDPATGLGSWTEEEFTQAVRFGLRPNGRPALSYPMQPYTKLREDEVSAIWAYLQTVPIIKNDHLSLSE